MRRRCAPTISRRPARSFGVVRSDPAICGLSRPLKVELSCGIGCRCPYGSSGSPDPISRRVLVDYRATVTAGTDQAVVEGHLPQVGAARRLRGGRGASVGSPLRRPAGLAANCCRRPSDSRFADRPLVVFVAEARISSGSTPARSASLRTSSVSVTHLDLSASTNCARHAGWTAQTPEHNCRHDL